MDRYGAPWPWQVEKIWLDVSGCFWMFLDVSGCFWMFLDVSGCFWMFLDGARFFEAQNLDLTWSPYNSAEYLSGQQVMGVQDGHRHAWEPTCLRWSDEARILVLLDPKRGLVDAGGIYHRRVKLQHFRHVIPAKRCNDYNHINNWIITIGASGSGHCN